MNQPDKPLNLELLPGGAREAVRELLAGESSDGSGELSSDVLDALAVDSPLLPPREPVAARLASYFGRHQLLLLLGCFLALWAIVAAPLHLGDVDLRIGSTAAHDIVAPQNAFAFDADETQKRRERASALVPPAYNPNSSALGQALAELPGTAATARKVARAVVARSQSLKSPVAPLPRGVVPATKAVSLETLFSRRAGWKASRGAIQTLAGVSDARFEILVRATQSAVSQAYVRGRIRSDVPDDVLTMRPSLSAQVALFGHVNDLSAGEREAALALGTRVARFPNMIVNEERIERARRDARGSVAPVYQKIEANASLVREGERISPAQFALLQELGLTAPKIRPFEILANGALCLMLVVSASFFLARGQRELLSRPAALWLVAFVPVVFLGLFRLILRVPHADFLMIPLAATAAMLITVLLDARVGLASGFVVAALCALMARADAGLFLGATLSAWIGSLSVANLSSRLALARAACVLAGTNTLLALALGALRGAPLDEIASTAAWSAGAGLASVAAMAASAIFLERPFGITSHLRLLELMAPDETVIRRMQVEAPGTYTHSLMVATLGEAAAKTIGADPLLCRVAGLYHDIGKLRRPHCFIENQCGDNIHDRISPALSALLIKAHVKDGLELGRALRLPQPVLDAVASHHGKGAIAFFLARAKLLAGEAGVDERLFCYPGPRPQSKEAAILLLADSVEASARSLSHPTPEILANHIESIVAAKLREGELDECDLSLKEMALVREAFATTLRGAMHGRVSYPDAAHLQGELAASSSDWVRQTLSDDARRGVEIERVRLEKTKTGESGQSRSEENPGTTPTPSSKRTRGQLRRRLRSAKATNSASANDKTPPSQNNSNEAHP